jgi:hypothetical protein
LSIHGEECFEAYVYLDHYYPPVQWNIVRGVFNSPSCLPESKQNNLLSVSMATMLINDTADRLVSELWLDDIRNKHYPDNVSRLRGIFVFDDLDSLFKLWENNNWGGHFYDEHLADVGVAADKSSRLDSNWVSEIIDDAGKLLPGWETAAHSYWQGSPHHDKEPIWERIVEGTITVWSSDIKETALKDIQAIWPQSLNLLRYSILCAGYCSFDGQMFPILLTKSDRIELVYCLRMVQISDVAFIDALNNFIEYNPSFNSSLHSEGEDLLPDLTGFSKVITPSDSDGFGDLVKRILTENIKFNEEEIT